MTDLDRHACQQAVKERFSATRMVDDHLRLYRQVLDPRAAEPEAEAKAA